jgi:hypothetical protein
MKKFKVQSLKFKENQIFKFQNGAGLFLGIRILSDFWSLNFEVLNTQKGHS